MSPTVIPIIVAVEELSIGMGHVIAIGSFPSANSNSSAKFVYSWGDNRQGQLGRSTIKYVLFFYFILFSFLLINHIIIIIIIII